MTIIKSAYLIMGLLIMLALIVYPLIFILHTRETKKLISMREEYEKKIKDLTDTYNARLTAAEETNEALRIEHDTMLDNIGYKDLSYEQVNTIVNDIIDEIWTQKYQLSYLLRGIDIIPDMGHDVAEMAGDVTRAINENLWINILKYYSKEYFGAQMARQVEMLFIDYTNKHKPPSK